MLFIEVYFYFMKAVRQGRYTIELRTNTILEVKRLANKTAIEVSIDNCKDKSNRETSSDSSTNCGSCDSETSQSDSVNSVCNQSHSVSEETDCAELVDLSLSPTSSECIRNSPDCKYLVLIVNVCLACIYCVVKGLHVCIFVLQCEVVFFHI